MKTRFMGVAMTVVVALLGASVSLLAVHNERDLVEQTVMSAYMEKQESRIQTVEIEVAVLMAGLRGAPGPKGSLGSPGAPGATGPKGDKGGIKLFGK